MSHPACKASSTQEVVFHQGPPSLSKGLNTDYRTPPMIRETLARTMQHGVEPLAAPQRDESPAAFRRGRSDLHYNASPRHERITLAARSANHMNNAETLSFSRRSSTITEPEIDLIHRHRAFETAARDAGRDRSPAGSDSLGWILASDLHPSSSARSYRLAQKRCDAPCDANQSSPPVTQKPPSILAAGLERRPSWMPGL